MPSLRKKVTSYFRQLSFHNEPREKRISINENVFVNKYLTGQVVLREGPTVLYGKCPSDLPSFELGEYSTGSESITACSTGPKGGLTTVERVEKHLSVADPDIDFIDTQDETVSTEKAPAKPVNHFVDNTTMVIRVAGQEYLVSGASKKHYKSRSLGSIKDLNDAIGSENNNNVNKTNENVVISVNNNVPKEAEDPGSEAKTEEVSKDALAPATNTTKTNYGLGKSKSESDPFRHRKKGKIIRLTQRPQMQGPATAPADTKTTNDAKTVPSEWKRASDFAYGLSDSLYDANLVTKSKNGDPIADCFGIVARNDSAILALADGVNWGEKACIAAKSAVHASLEYLNKTIFCDTELFRSHADSSPSSPESKQNRIGNTSDVFVCLLRAFNCAHTLILENQGMLTTLTVAVVLPLKTRTNQKPKEHLYVDKNAFKSDEKKEISVRLGVEKSESHKNVPDAMSKVRSYAQRSKSFIYESSSPKRDDARRPKTTPGTHGPRRSKEFDTGRPQQPRQQYICCVCNVGDTLAYVYSQKYGMREITKGSHNIYCNRDMRDALGALGPVDGINPELNNLTLSLTTIEAGDIVMIASDGLTDNYDPTVCRFTVNTPSPKVTTVQTHKHHHSQPPSATASRKSITPERESRKPKASHTGGTPVRQRRSTSKESDKTEEKQHRTTIQFSTDGAEHPTPPPRTRKLKKEQTPIAESESSAPESPLVTEFLSNNPLDQKTRHTLDVQATQKPQTSVPKQTVPKTNTHNFLRSRTTLDIKPKTILRNKDGLPFVTPVQKYELTLLLMEDLLKHGISGHEPPCLTAKKLCENLLNFTFSITAAKRHTLEDTDLYYENRGGVLVELPPKERKQRRQRCLQNVQNLPGKLDHVSVVAYNVGNCSLFS